MAFLADWVAEQASNPGTSTIINLAGAASGPYSTFASKFATGTRVFYTISDEVSANETGIGTFTSGSPNTLSRDTVLANSLGTTSRVNFIGTVFVWNPVPASQAIFADNANVVNLPGALALSNQAQITGLDTGGTARSMLNIGTDNNVHAFAGNGGMFMVKDQSNNSLWTVDTNGTTVQTSTEWSLTTAVKGAVNAIVIRQTASPPSHANSIISSLAETASNHALFQFNGSAMGSITCASTSSVSYNTTSDARLKIDAREFDAYESGAIIDRLKPRWFRWKDDQDGNAEPGFFAQQVARIFPWAVTKGRGRPGARDFLPWQMDASKMVVLAIAELKALRRRVKDQDRRIAKLEAKVSQLGL